jgi:ribosomal protein S18 acetylase RimI-like enzyme
VIRVALAPDARAIAEVHIASWQAAYRGMIPDRVLDGLSVDEREQRWAGQIADPEAFVLVAEEGGRIAGFCCTLLPPGAQAEIPALYLHPDFWRGGIGTALQAAAVEELRARGYREVVLWVLELNEGARAFYERLGFVADWPAVGHDWADGAMAIRMKLDLG